MIYIKHNRNDEYGIPIRPNEEWFESSKVATELAISEGENHSANGTIYAHTQVRAALEKLFNGKCAYCDADITATDDWNVEHFRPKGRVAERKDHPGYYWLTYEWENLYPSCSHCNQRRKDRPIWGDLSFANAGGKMDQFPLQDELTRAMSHDVSVDHEQILLIDPSDDNPEVFLSYDITGQIISIRENLRGLVTIEICHLERRRLRDKRREKMKAVIDLLKFINKFKTTAIDATNDIKQILQDNFLDDKCEYAGVSRAVRNDPEAYGI